MTNPPTKRGGPRPGAGRKVGPSGPADARLNIKCTKAELDSYTAAAKEECLGRSAWVKSNLNFAANQSCSV